MAEEENYSHNFYAGADYGLDPNYGDEFSLGFSQGYQVPVSQFGVTTNPQTANQLKEVSDKISTGAKHIEIEGISSQVFEAVPQQHLEEINRLKKITGIDLTFHGPVIEPSGITRYGTNEANREQAETQMWSAVQRAHKLDPQGNVVVTFHSSEGVPTPIVKSFDEKTGKEQIKEFFTINEQTGQLNVIPTKPSYFKGEDQLPLSPQAQVEKLKDDIKKQNKDAWFAQLQGVSYHIAQGKHYVDSVFQKKIQVDPMMQKTGVFKGEEVSEEELKESYKKYVSGELDKELAQFDPKLTQPIKDKMSDITHADLYLRDSYQNLQNLFNQAYEVAKRNNFKSDLKKLDKFREEIKPKIDYIEDPSKIKEFAGTILKGVNVLRTINPPQSVKSLRDFTIEKSAETFSNLTLNSYNKFKDSAPIISIENPPVGIGLSYAEDLRDLVDESRKKFVQKAKSEGISESEAKNQAEKLIGATWDVGHINMARKYGLEKKGLVEETKKIAPYVKHVHLSDNFGMEHTELPMGTGNVPTKPMLEAISKYNKQVKKIIEGADWFRYFSENVPPLKESLRAFGSPVYSMKMAPTWGQAADTLGNYSTGYGQILPEQHMSLYGAGFSDLPPELGGQLGGRSRVGGTPME